MEHRFNMAKYGYSNSTGRKLKVTKGPGYTEYTDIETGKSARSYKDGRPVETIEAPADYDKEAEEYEFNKQLYGKDVADRKVPVKPTEIDTKSGGGVPGGFEASSVKTPEAAASKASSNMAAIQEKSAALATTSPPGASAAQSKLDKLMEKQKQRQLDALNAPKFKSNVNIPSPPEPPDVPDFDALGIPKTPGIGGFSVAGLTIGAGLAATLSTLSEKSGTRGGQRTEGTQKISETFEGSRISSSLASQVDGKKTNTHSIMLTIYKVDK